MGEPYVKHIVERCQQGDRKAFGQLYTLMYDNLRKICRHYVSDETTVDDLLHDAFLLIFTKIGSIKDSSKAEAWMQKVVQNLALAYLKQTKQQTTVPLDSLQETLTLSEAPSPEVYDEIMSHVDHLPKSYQQVFRLSVLEGMGHQEIAEVLNIEPHTSSADLFRAKVMLRRSLAVLLLGLLAIGLPIGLWHLLQSSPEQELAGNGVRKTENTMAETTPAVSPQDTTKQTATLVQPLKAQAQKERPKDSLLLPPVAEVAQTEVNAADTTGQHTESPAPMPITIEKTPRTVVAETPEIPVSNESDNHDWMLALAFNGISSRESFNLPPGSYDPNEQEIDTITHHRLPLTIALSVNKMISNRWAIGTGLQYTQLYSETQAGNTFSWVEQSQRLHYLGIPLRVAWYPVKTSRWALYTSAQTMMEVPLGSSCKEKITVNDNLLSTMELQLKPSIQWSVGLGVGLEYRLTPVIGLYTEPSVNYFFKSGDGIDTYRTVHPATFSIPIGIRINM